jgi:hypothetical protein
MSRTWQLCLLLCLAIGFFADLGYSQAPVGTISGTVYDESGAVIPGVEITIKNKDTGAERKVVSGEDGSFTAAALAAGEYEITATAKGFRTLRRTATVATGAVVTAEMRMVVGAAAEVVNVEAATAQINYEQHSIDGVISRQKIQELPLNGRSFLQLAFLEPGVTVSPGTTSQRNSLFSVSILGGDTARTSIQVDGGNVRNAIEGGTGMNFSQEVVQEFQLSAVNFDLSTGITSVGSVNIVTRTGGNDLHGSGYFFFRDHNMAAFPGLARNPLAPDPFFARRNPGFWVSGPIVRDKLFFFFNYEYTNQTQVFVVQPNVPSVAGLTGVYPSPYRAKTLSARFDYRLNTNNQLFARYSHDGNRGFGPNAGAQPPSNWLRNTNWSDQSALGWTSTFRPTMVSDFRFSYQYWQNRNLFPTENECPGCLGLGFPQLNLVGSNVALGNTSNATQGRDLRRFQFTENVTWQKGAHRIRFGGEWEYAPGTGFWGYCDPGCLAVATPELVRGAVPASLIPVLFPNMPSTIRTSQDLQNLPFIVGGAIGIGDPSQPPPYNVDKAKLNQRLRFFAQDSWRLKPRFTLNYGLAWNFESTLVNRDLGKPEFLRPLYGNDLGPTSNNYRNFSPALGFAWQPTGDNKTVIRGGTGIYWDTEVLWRRLQERAYTGPVGNGRIQYPLTGFVNTVPGVLNMSQGGVPIPVGAPLTPGLTTLTLNQFLTQIFNPQIGPITASLAPKNLNDLSVRNIDISKAAAQLYPKRYPVQRSYHMNVGVQRELARDFVLSVDYVRRVFVNTLLGELDYNRFNRFINGVQTPVIPRCTSAQAAIVGFPCSTGPISFWTPAGRNVYNGLLVKFDKRFSNRFQFTASYALTHASGYDGIVNLDRWNASWGPQQARHILNVSGIVELPWNMQLGIISASSSLGPQMPFLGSVDLDGDGIATEPLPGLKYNCLNRSCGKTDLVKAVENWNSTYAGKRDARGQVIQAVKLPARYSFGRPFNSQDVRLTKFFDFRERYKLSVFAEMFNVLNYANYTGFSFTLDPLAANPAQQGAAFGNPTQRAGQVFGSGGPRALQIGGRFQF